MEYVPGEGEDETILGVLGDLESQGFTGQFMPRDGGQVECLTCHRLSPADETVFRQLRRLEGASDPADMLAVYRAGARSGGGRPRVPALQRAGHSGARLRAGSRHRRHRGARAPRGRTPPPNRE